MNTNITLTKEALTRMLRDAYTDGREDGSLEGPDATAVSDAVWNDSVTKDRLDAALEEVRNGKRVLI